MTHRSWFGRLGSSLAGVLIGLILFPLSFWLLVWNEGRALDAINALDAGQRSVMSVPAERVDPANDGWLVHVAGPTSVPGPLVDPVFRVGGPGLLRLQRDVEMYQWREEEESTTEKSLGGGETTRTVYRYIKDWSSKPIDSSAFKRPEGHANPPMAYTAATFDSRPVKLGAFTLDPKEVRQIDAFEPLGASAANDKARLPGGFRWVGDRIHRGASSESPQIGDIRVSFSAVPVQPVSVVARQVSGGLATFRSPNGHEIDLVAVGLHSADAMFQQAKDDENLLTWVLRGVGFLMMLFGVVLMARPLVWLASLIPFLETVMDFAAFGLGLVIALPLTLLTIALAWLAYRPLLGIGLLVAAVVAAVLVRRLLPRRTPASPPPLIPA